MADLNTPAEIEAELAATATYDVDNDVAMAKRRVAALRRKLDFPQSAGRGDAQMEYQLQIIENQLRSALAFVMANTSPSDAQRLNNPSVLHADFSTFGKYNGGNCG